MIDLPGTTVVAEDPWAAQDDAPVAEDQWAGTYNDGFTPRPTGVPDAVAETRARKYNYALGNESPGVDVLKYDVISGNEPQRRVQQVERSKLEEQNLRIDLMRAYVNQEGANADPEVARSILNSTSEELNNPETFYEKAFARRFIADMATADYEPTDVDGIVIDDSALSQAGDPEDAQKILDAGQLIKVNQESDTKIAEDLNAEAAAMGWGETIYNHGKALIPFTSWSNLSGVVEGAKTSSFLLGNNLEEQYEYLNSITDPDRRRMELLRAVDELKSSNIIDAQVFVQGLISYTASDKFLNNAVSLLDLSIPLPVVGVGSAKAYKALGRSATAAVKAPATGVANLTKAAVQASMSPGATPASVMAAVGQTAKSGLMQVIGKLSKQAEATVGGGRAWEYTQLVDETPILSNPAAVTKAAGHLGREAALRLEDTLAEGAQTLFKMTYDNALQSGRINGDVLQAALDDVRDTINTSFAGKSNIVIDVTPENIGTAYGNAQYANVLVGKNNAELFSDPNNAINVNDMFYGFANAEVVPVGSKYALAIKVPIDETSVSVRKALSKITTEKEATQKSLGNLFLPFLRSSKDRWEKSIGAEADAALMGGSQLVQVAKQILAPIGKLSSKEYEELDVFLNYERDYKIGVGQPRGRYSDTVAELESHWISVHGTLPNEKQITSYFANRQINDFGWVMTNAGLFRDKSRKGLQNFGVLRGMAQTIEGKLVKSDVLSESAENAGIVVVDQDLNSATQLYKNWISQAEFKNLKQMIDSGQYKLIQVSEFGEQAFKEMFKDLDNKIGSADFIVARNTTQAPLDFRQIPYRPGGHVELDDGYFISQANIHKAVDKKTKNTVSTYYGDKNLYHFVSERDGQKVVANMETAREMLYKAMVSDRGNKGYHITQLQQYLNKKANLPHSFNEFYKMFVGKNATYKLDEPFRLRRKDESLATKYAMNQNFEKYPNFINKKDSHWNLYKGGVNLEWAGKRGDHIYTVENKGSTVNPTYNLSEAKHVNALTTTNRASQAAMRGKFMDDFKHMASERFIAEFGDLLESPAEIVRSNPFKALIDGQFKQGLDKDLRLAAAKASRRATLEFLGSKTLESQAMDVVRAKLWQKTLDIRGTDKAYAASDLLTRLDGWAFGAIKDPVSFMRSLAFHQKLGLFNPAQLILQMQTMTHVLAVGGPVNGLKGFEATIHHIRAMLNPDHFDFLATKLTSWDPKELKESWDWANRSGWYRVGREVAVRSDFLDENLFQAGFKGTMTRGVEMGTMPFREGERITRMSAWNAAFHEFKRANPGKAITDLEAKQILNRADLMSVNMTAASNAAWQRGVLGVPTQFWGYQARLMEQLLGKRLTPTEKARAFATYSFMYGVPVAGAAFTGVWPWHETVRQEALERGIPIEGVNKILLEGAPSALLGAFTGEDFNFAERFGPGGLPILEDIINGDTTMIEALGGVSGTTTFENIKATAPFLYGVANLLSFKTLDPAWTMTTDDIIDIARTTSTGNQAYNVLTAYTLGKYIGKNGTVTDRIQGWESLLGLWGLTPIRISDAYRIIENEKTRKDWQKKGMKEAVDEYRKSLNDSLAPADQAAHWQRTRKLMDQYDLDLDQRRQVVTDTLNRNEGMARSVSRRAAENPGPYREYFEQQELNRKAREQ